MNRAGLGLAVGAGYVLGRTKKLKLAFAVGTLVAGKRMNLTPRALADLVSGQLRNNPQFKELGDQLRQDLRGVGGAATGALVERQLDALADRLHDRTAGVRDRLGGAVPRRRSLGDDEQRDGDRDDDRYGDDRRYEDEDRGAGARHDDHDDEAGHDDEPDAGEPRSADRERRAGEKGGADRTASKPPGRKTAPAKKAAAKRTAARKTTASAKTAARKTAPGRSRTSKGGDDR
ncbi:DNA primase [Streptomyces cinereospinus]|uniref:DNA primase n=1 Tax=Streptomyces cinereospinus TaxID=285561 RepID=A0ABV5N8X5_9ACTN